MTIEAFSYDLFRVSQKTHDQYINDMISTAMYLHNFQKEMAFRILKSKQRHTSGVLQLYRAIRQERA